MNDAVTLDCAAATRVGDQRGAATATGGREQDFGVEAGIRRIVERGTGAARQRDVHERTGDLVEVTRSLLL